MAGAGSTLLEVPEDVEGPEGADALDVSLADVPDSLEFAGDTSVDPGTVGKGLGGVRWDDAEAAVGGGLAMDGGFASGCLGAESLEELEVSVAEASMCGRRDRLDDGRRNSLACMSGSGGT